MMQPLNLPDYQLRIVQREDTHFIFDPIRKKEVILTPEEWVRQNLLQYLIQDLGYPSGLIKVEFGIKVNKLSKRPDILIFDQQGSPLVLVECKAPSEKIDSETLFQASVYNREIKASYIILSNGIDHVCCTPEQDGNLQFLDQFPRYESIKKGDSL